MVLSGEPESRKELVYLAHLITNNNGLQVCVNVKKVRLKQFPCIDICVYE